MVEETLDLQAVKQRSVTGLLVLISRSVLMQLIALGGFFFLSSFLQIAEVGLFFAVSEIVAIMGYFSDIGLAAALVQRKENLTHIDLRTTFTIQQLLVTSLCLLAILFTPWLGDFFNLADSGRWLLWALIAGFFLASLKTVPSVLLERHLKFDKLVIVETIETISFYVIAVVLAWQGRGVLSYAVAVVVRGLLGTAFLYYLAPWPIGLTISKTSLKHLLSFGLPYQLNTLIAMVKDRFLNILLWKFIGAEGMGIIGWAQTWSQKPLRFLSDNITKVTFPAFARMQSEPEALKRAIERMLLFSSLTIFPILVGAGIIAKPLLDIIPRYQKWEPALFAFYLYLFNSGWAAISTPITNTLAAIGEIKTVSKLMSMWTILTWAVIAPLGFLYSYNGVALGVAIVSLSSIVPIVLLHRRIDFAIWQPIGQPLVASLIMGILVWLSLRVWENTTFLNLVISSLIGVISYGILIWWWLGKEITGQVKKVLVLRK